MMAPALTILCAALVIPMIRRRGWPAPLLTAALFLSLGAKLPLHLAALMPAQAERASRLDHAQLILVPEPDPASRGILLDRWARASAPLVRLY